ncbi:MAG: YdeI/OmpD-associated family protein [Candidatus Bathyarchaeota archaeon]|nr:MAG: YdeI/OmpD-associated family protein [Candidatus Bathyarchaeota archaeon]
MKTTPELHAVSRSEWRKWLETHYDTERTIWLVYYKKHTGKPSIAYDDSVEEALCFGWIDSIIKRIDNEKFARKFTPRKRNCSWSEVNKKRARKMMTEGKMTRAGRARIEEAKRNGEWFRVTPRRQELLVPSYMKKALATNQVALDNFSKLAKTYQQDYVGWITSAKREGTRKRRLRQAIQLLERNEKLGMK